MAVKCFFSGVEGKSHYEACRKAGVVNVLASYLQFFQKGDLDFVKKRKLANPEMNFIIDSGAHSFLVADAKAKWGHWKQADFEKYVQGYCDWLRKNKDYIFAAVELDIEAALNTILGTGTNSSIGLSIVTSWQDRYFRPLQAEGIEIIYVWHTERKMEGWEEMCRKFSYVGLPGEMTSNADVNKYFSVARRYSTKVHGFAATKQTDFRDWPWASIDSITWKTSEMYGTLIDWDERKQLLKFEEDKTKRVNYRAKFEKFGLDAEGIIRDTNYKAVTEYALISFRQMEKFYERKYAQRLFYYDLRLPHPSVLLKGISETELRKLWLKFRPETLFKDHVRPSLSDLRTSMAAISAVQNNMDSVVKGSTAMTKFLGHYFPALVYPLTPDFTIFQKELAVYTSPPNPPALSRTEEAHYVPSNNPPRMREAVSLSEGLDQTPEEDVIDQMTERFALCPEFVIGR